MDDATDFLVGGSRPFAAFVERLRLAAASDATVLLEGESGSGKSAAARALHAWSARAAGPFQTVHVSALPSSLIEAELFGHEKGAFTDAHRARLGFFRRCDGGTLVLDDVDLLPLSTQVKLLRVLQERVVDPVGGESSVPVDVRVVATAGRDLRGSAEAGRFRDDLYWRLAVVRLEPPPLRARPGDLPRLVEPLIARLARRLGVPARPLAAEALERLELHSWPGNVRELENALERVLVLPPPGARPGSTVQSGELAFLEEATRGALEELARQALACGASVDELTEAMMLRALEEQHGNVSAAARRVGLTRRAFEYRRPGGRPRGGGQGPSEAGQVPGSAPGARPRGGRS